jgi:hypothetical protein
MQSSAFGYTPAPYSPSMPSDFARYGRPDTTWSGGIGSLNAGRIPLTGGRRRRSSRRSSRRSVKHSRKNGRKHTRRSTHRRRTVRRR